MNTELMTSNPATIRAYFEKVRQLVNQGQEFPVSLDDIWPLCYERKDYAVAALRRDFMEDVDFQVFLMLPENSKGGRKAEVYLLTVSCMEYFIARKIREVFNVYREVFHRVVQPPAPAELTRKELAMLVIQAEEEKERLQKQIEQQAPKVQYADAILNTDDCVVTTVVATELGYTAVSFNKKLKTLGVQWKVDDVWVLTSKYLNKGYTQMRTHVFTDPATSLLRTRQYMVWTQRGRALLWWMLKGQEPPVNLQIEQGV